MGDASDTRGFLYYLVALPAAGVLSIIVAAATSSALIRVMPMWASESVGCALAGAIWMWIVFRIAGRHPIGDLVSFIPGAMASWILTMAITRDTSPLFGVIPFGCACIGAALAMQFSGSVEHRSQWLTSVPLLTFLVVAVRALSTPNFGVIMQASDRSGQAVIAHVAQVGGQTWLWVPANVELGDATLIDLEGSGAYGHSIHRESVSDSLTVRCDRFHAVGSELLEKEVADGGTPRFITWLPMRRIDCAKGSFWTVK